jgi:hypothetical protein
VHDGGDVLVVGHVLAVPVCRLHADGGVEVAQVPPVQHRRLHTDAEKVRQSHHSQLPDTRNTQCGDGLFACSTNVRQGSITIRRSHRRRRKSAGSPFWRCGPGATRRSSGTPRGTAAPNIPWQMKITNVELITVHRHRPNTRSGRSVTCREPSVWETISIVIFVSGSAAAKTFRLCRETHRDHTYFT